MVLTAPNGVGSPEGVHKMEPTTLHTAKTSASRGAAEPNAKPANQPPLEPSAEPAIELDRRGKPLPPRQRVGGIITPR
jgi:hypothetical protein